MSDPDATPADMDRALLVFLASGFHGAGVGELEAATGLSWQEIQALYTDKEGLFYAAVDARLGAETRAGLTLDEVMAMLLRLERANSNPRLRAIHKQALRRVTELAGPPEAVEQ